jgi:hypothetical protein
MKSSIVPDRFIVDNQIYFDTSSINELINRPIEYCISTQHLWAKKNRCMCLSAINLYEIFKTSDSNKREEIIYKMGILFYGKSGYLDMPTRILFGEVLGYFTNGLTAFEKSFRDSWFNVKRDPNNQTFKFDFDDFSKRRKILKSLAKTLKFILKDEFVHLSEGDIFDLRNDIDPIVYITSLAIKKMQLEFTNMQTSKTNYVKLMLVYSIFSFGVEPQNEFLEKYWNSQDDGRNNIKGILARAVYLLNSYYDELFNSPFLTLMTEFILYESAHKGIGRGTLSDALHLIYSYYCFIFITDDKSILDFAKTQTFLDGRVLSVKNNFFKHSSL